MNLSCAPGTISTPLTAGSEAQAYNSRGVLTVYASYLLFISAEYFLLSSCVM